MKFIHRNSPLATAISFPGGLAAIYGILQMNDGKTLIGLLWIIAGMAAMYYGWQVSKDKDFDSWWNKELITTPEEEIASSQMAAFQIWGKSPDQARALKKLMKLNPEAAQQIAEIMEDRKKKKK